MKSKQRETLLRCFTKACKSIDFTYLEKQETVEVLRD